MADLNMYKIFDLLNIIYKQTRRRQSNIRTHYPKLRSIFTRCSDTRQVTLKEFTVSPNQVKVQNKII
jgi:hypothetical protein